MTKVLLLAALSAILGAQSTTTCSPGSVNCFFAQASGTLNASASTTLTLQQPTTGTNFRNLKLWQALAQCPGQTFTVEQSQNGTAATATAGSVVALIPTQGATSAANVFTASNVGAGTSTAPALAYGSSAPSIAVIDLSQRSIPASSGFNYNIKLSNTGSASCSYSIAIYWSQQ